MSAANKRRMNSAWNCVGLALKSRGEEKRGALILITKCEGHLKGGGFGAAKMIEMLGGAVKDALDAGFAGLCTAGDMNWLRDDAPGSHEILEYEALLNHFFGDPTNKALGLCQYNRNTLPAKILDTCMATHKHTNESEHLMTRPRYSSRNASGTLSRISGGSDAKSVAQVWPQLSHLNVMTVMLLMRSMLPTC
jgi:hypothetical protein